MTPTPFVVGLVARPGTSARARALVVALGRHVEVRSRGRALRPDALLVTAPEIAVDRPDGVPVATVHGDVVRVRRGDREVELALPAAPGVDTAAMAPLAPHVRRRWRQRLGLAPDLVVETATLDPADVPTALAVAAAAVVPAADLPLALALGCPTVTDREAARAVGAGDEEVAVGDRATAEALAADDARAAGLSRRGRALAAAALDPDVTARALLAAWGLADPAGPVARVEAALDGLGTAPAAPVRARVDAALALLAPTGGT